MKFTVLAIIFLNVLTIPWALAHDASPVAVGLAVVEVTLRSR
ncbi:MAG: hypothetical protein WB810_00695 [Candidatus Cybelea sp.]